MKYASHLKKIFKDTKIDIEDLLLMEPFQIRNLPERVPEKEFATLLRVHPIIQRFLQKKEPSIKPFLEKVLHENKPENNAKTIEEYCNELLWEIGELIIYNKYPETYDEKIKFTWEIDEIILPELLDNKTIADIGAGSGMLTSLLANYAKTTYAIEPLNSFRCFMRKRFKEKHLTNIFVIEGFLNCIPLPDDSLDILFTSNALGWDFENEQKEITRVVKPGGPVIHLMRAFDKDVASPYHEKLLEYNYQYQQLKGEGFKAKYSKVIY
jgi:ubiquinone/menaquinone biosynthesis C-methylase UbiE